MSDAVPDDDGLARLVALEGVASAFASTRDGIDALLRDRGLRRTSVETTVESLLRGANATAELEGIEPPLALYSELAAVAPTLISVPLQGFARLHVLVAKGSLPDDELGRPRDGGAEVLRDIGRLISAPTTAPALVLAAVVHAEIATRQPFASYNGVIARAAERAILMAKGLDPTTLTVPEAGHLALRPQYESNLQAYARGVPQAWLLYAAEAFAAGAEGVTAEVLEKQEAPGAKTQTRCLRRHVSRGYQAWKRGTAVSWPSVEPAARLAPIVKGRSRRGCLGHVRVLELLSPFYARG